MRSFFKLFQKVGGKEILRQYRQGHNLFFALFLSVLLGLDKKSLEILRLAVNNRLLKRLRKKYSQFLAEWKATSQNNSIIQEKMEEYSHRKVWICWFQGMDQAPDVVRRCFESIKKNITDREIVLITEENYEQYVQFPGYIQDKIRCSIIQKTHMSDLLRLELLTRYGGTWIDATVYCSSQCPGYMLDSELFLFQNLKPGLDGHATHISSWFITAERGNIMLKLTLAFLYDYWKKNDQLVDYFIFHDFFQLAIETYPEKWRKVVPFSNSLPHILLLRLFDIYDERIWTSVKEQTPFHKLSYKFTEEQAKTEGTYYRKVLGL